MPMHIISLKMLRDFWQKHPETEGLAEIYSYRQGTKRILTGRPFNYSLCAAEYLVRLFTGAD